MMAGRLLDSATLIEQVTGVGKDLLLVLDEPSGAVAAAFFLVAGRDEDHVALEQDAGAFDRQHRHQLDHARTLVIDRTAAPDIAVLDLTREGWHLPLLGIGRHHVHVAEQHDRLGVFGRYRADAPPPRRARVFGSQTVAGIPSARNLSRSIRAAPSSLPGGLVVSIRMYWESSAVASCVSFSQLKGWGAGAWLKASLSMLPAVSAANPEFPPIAAPRPAPSSNVSSAANAIRDAARVFPLRISARRS